jgi:hypothetical protein
VFARCDSIHRDSSEPILAGKSQQIGWLRRPHVCEPHLTIISTGKLWEKQAIRD